MKNQAKNQVKTTVQKETVALYFSTELLEKLEELHFYVQRQIPRERRKRLSKSQLCELCLECIITDYELNKSSGILWKNINNWLER